MRRANDQGDEKMRREKAIGTQGKLEADWTRIGCKGCKHSSLVLTCHLLIIRRSDKRMQGLRVGGGGTLSDRRKRWKLLKGSFRPLVEPAPGLELQALAGDCSPPPPRRRCLTHPGFPLGRSSRTLALPLSPPPSHRSTCRKYVSSLSMCAPHET